MDSDFVVNTIAFVTSKIIDLTVEYPSRKLYEIVFIESLVPKIVVHNMLIVTVECSSRKLNEIVFIESPVATIVVHNMLIVDCFLPYVLVKECKKQWNARDAFRRHQKKLKTASGQASVIVKKWKLYEEMGFLLPFMQDRPIVSSLEITNTQNSQTRNELEAEIGETGENETVNENMSMEEGALKRNLTERRQMQKKNEKRNKLLLQL